MLAQANSAYTAAAGETPIVSTLDLMTLAALSRMVIEDSVMPVFGGKQAAPLLAVHRELEGGAWTLSDEFLTKEQEDEVLAIMVEWRKGAAHRRHQRCVRELPRLRTARSAERNAHRHATPEWDSVRRDRDRSALGY